MKRLWGVLIVCCGLSGCAGMDRRPWDAEVAQIDTTLVGGMSQIRDKALDPPDIDRLYLAALAHLSVIEPDLRADTIGNEVALSLGEMIIARTPRPRSQDIGAWTEATQNLLADARRVSLPLSRADSETLLSALFDGVMPQLDAYSRYASRREARRNQVMRNGFVGLGLDLEPVAQGASVRLTLKDGPADKAGVLPGDIILRAQGLKLSGQPLPVILRRLDGPRDTPVHLRILRDGAEFDVTARRELIIPETVQAEDVDGLLHLTVKSFNQRTAATIAEKVASAGALRGIILDMRGDPGGLLDQAVAIADLFLDKGVIATLRGRHPGAMQFYAAAPGDIAPNVPIVMLVDGRSASAAEILGAALQENGRAIAVGTATVGKGTVQTIVPLANGGEMALSWARVFTPDGTVLAGRGVLPDVCTAGSAGAAADLVAGLARTGPRPRPAAEIVRATCRPEPHGADPRDAEVASHLVTDAGLRAFLHPAHAGQLATSP